MRTFVTSLWKQNDGNIAVEFALVAPIFLAVIFGIIEMGNAYLAFNNLQYARDQAARYAMLHPLADSDTIKGEIADYLVTVPYEDLVVSVEDTTVNGLNYKRIVLSYPIDNIFSNSFSSEPYTLSTETTIPTFP